MRIHQSGSEGPIGTEAQHRSASRRRPTTSRLEELWLCLRNQSSLTEITSVLVTGATMAIQKPVERSEAPTVRTFLKRHSITVYFPAGVRDLMGLRHRRTRS